MGDINSLARAIEKISVHDHLCLIYENKEEQFAAAIPFMRIGLERGEKCIYIADDNTAAEVLNAMRIGGIAVDEALKKGSLAVIGKKDAYLRNGYFDPDEMIKFLTESTDAAKKEGYTALRATGEMTWMLGGEKGTDRLIEYEAKLNRFFPHNDALALCQYNRQRFGPAILLDVIHTHPIVVVGNTVCKNFYYVPVEDFLREGKGTAEEVDRLFKSLIDRERIEREMREGERELKEAQRIGKIGNWSWDIATDKIIWSEEYYRLIGFDPAKAPPGYEEHLKAYTQESQTLLDTAVKKQMQTGEPYELDLEFANPQSTCRWITARSETIRDTAGKVIGLRGTAQDITEHKKSEEELKRATHDLHMILESTDEGIYGVDKEGYCTFVNKAALKILGYEQEEVLGRNSHVTWHHKHLDGSPYPYEECPIYTALMKGKDDRVSDEVFWLKSGAPLPVEYSTFPILDNGIIKGGVVTFRDITERKKAEKNEKKHLQEVENMNKLMVGRELKMIELKKENERLAKQLAQR
ncbi:MAG: MEDS domain-containing protein [Candidatus Paceibacterota bacterium]|jgi:PAS domain S-box-containing protein